MTDRSNPPKRPGSNSRGTITTGFHPLAGGGGWDRECIYRIVEVLRDSHGRLHKQGHVWHNDLDMLRRFGRALAANTASHKVLITNARGDVIEDLPIAPPEARRSAWTSWGGVALPPAPPVRKSKPAAAVTPHPVPAIVTTGQAPVVTPLEATPAAIPASPPVPPRDIPKLPVDQMAGFDSPLPGHLATLP